MRNLVPLAQGLGLMLLASLAGCDASGPAAAKLSIPQEAPPTAISEQTRQQIQTFCGDCHALPRPQSFHRDRWHFEVRRGYEFYAKSGRNDLIVPPLKDTLAWFRSQAPEQLTFPKAKEAAGELPLSFETEQIPLDLGVQAFPEIADMDWQRLAADETPVLLLSDLRHGQILAVDLQRRDRKPPQVLARLRNPGRIDICDLDDDGLAEILVADLGSYLPAEHDRGRIMLLRRNSPTDPFETLELLTDLARVADVRADDLDDDSRPDLVVAEFGWRETGRLLWARNVSEPKAELAFDRHTIDDRSGCLDVRTHDFTGDGRPDIVALFSQEHETVDLFENHLSTSGGGPGGTPDWVRTIIDAAPDLTFGFTGIELVDLNDDGLMDVLATNGDAFDNTYVTPWHGVAWYENRGDLTFVRHRLTELPGAYGAQAGDFDRDGDLDVIAVSRLPVHPQPSNLPAPAASIVLLLQNDAGQFDRHTLETGSPNYPTVTVGDFDENGWLDFAVASGPYAAGQNNSVSPLTLWWNQGPGPSDP